MTNYRKQIDTTIDLAAWYDAKYTEMGDGWHTPPKECNQHLDDLGVPFDKTKTLLDVGFGAGHFLAEATKRVQCWGMEISHKGWEYARKRLDGEVKLIVLSVEGACTADWPVEAIFDYIVSIGSLEHVVELDLALNNIRKLLKPTGRFYFYCPNEHWVHMDQPNERTMPDAEWKALFEQHGLHVHWAKPWNDSTAFCGGLTMAAKKLGLNVGSGQRPFKSTPEIKWTNMDINPRWEPDVVGDWSKLDTFSDSSFDIVVAEQTVEHVGCGDAVPFFKEAHRVLKPGGVLVITMPDLKALARRWLVGQIDDFIYSVNLYGAWMGHDADRHKWNTSYEGWVKFLNDAAFWQKIVRGGSVEVPVASDWWVMRIEATK